MNKTWFLFKGKKKRAAYTVVLDWISMITYNLFKKNFLYIEKKLKSLDATLHDIFLLSHISGFGCCYYQIIYAMHNGSAYDYEKETKSPSQTKAQWWIHLCYIAYRTTIHKLTSVSIPDDISHKLYLLSHCTNAEHTFYEHTGQNIELINIHLK